MSARVMIVDDQAMIRRGLRMIVDSEPDMAVVAEAGDGDEAIAAAARLAPDVILMDVRMPRLDGLAAAGRILAAQPATRILVLTTFDLDEYVYEALRVGASGFLLKNASPEELVRAVRVVAGGEALLDPAVTRRVIERFAGGRPAGPSDAAPGLADLTAREREILLLMARGMANAEIADALVVSTSTVKNHVAAVLTKLGLRDRTQAVVFAYEAGLVRPGEAGAPV
ncbi:MAG: response regulator [Thermoleophilia bacterium]